MGRGKKKKKKILATSRAGGQWGSVVQCDYGWQRMLWMDAFKGHGDGVILHLVVVVWPCPSVCLSVGR